VHYEWSSKHDTYLPKRYGGVDPGVVNIVTFVEVIRKKPDKEDVEVIRKSRQGGHADDSCLEADAGRVALSPVHRGASRCGAPSFKRAV